MQHIFPRVSYHILRQELIVRVAILAPAFSASRVRSVAISVWRRRIGTEFHNLRAKIRQNRYRVPEFETVQQSTRRNTLMGTA
jgi:hypothetical protein